MKRVSHQPQPPFADLNETHKSLPTIMEGAAILQTMAARVEKAAVPVGKDYVKLSVKDFKALLSGARMAATIIDRFCTTVEKAYETLMGWW